MAENFRLNGFIVRLLFAVRYPSDADLPSGNSHWNVVVFTAMAYATSFAHVHARIVIGRALDVISRNY
jgi:hypothetical protein